MNQYCRPQGEWGVTRPPSDTEIDLHLFHKGKKGRSKRILKRLVYLAILLVVLEAIAKTIL